MLDLALTDKTVVVTGGASNIGRGIVHGFAGQAANIVLVDIDEARARLTCEEALALGARECTFLQADLSTSEGCTGAIEHAIEAFDGVDVLVNNFGWGDPGLLLNTTSEQWDALWRMNLNCTIACSQAALADMKYRQCGNVVSLASDAAQGVPNQSVYGALKAGVVSFTKAIAKEFGRYNIRANVVAPGIVYPEAGTAGEKSVWNRGETVLSEKQIQDTYDSSALRRGTEPGDIAQAVLFFASETTARQVTGQTMSVSGGWWMP